MSSVSAIKSTSQPIGGQVCDATDKTCHNRQPLLRVLTPKGGRFMWLHKGRAGNLETAAEMATLVREDAWRDEGLKRYAAQLLINAGLDSHSDPLRILDVVFRHVQTTIKYIADPAGEFDAIHSARHTLATGIGDCDDLSVLLATLLAEVGFSPAFVLARYKADNEGFDHIYLEVPTKRGRIVLDPTTRQHGIGWENPRYLERKVFPIFGDGTGLGANVVPLAATGAQIGLSFIPVVGPILSALVGPIAGLFHHGLTAQQQQIESVWNSAVAQAVQAFAALAARASISQSDYDAAANTISALDQFVAQNASADKDRIKNQWYNDANYRAAFVSQLAKLQSKIAGAAGQGQFGSTAAVGSLNVSGPGGLNVSLPTVLLLGAAAYFLLRR